jgi:choline-sulfatase
MRILYIDLDCLRADHIGVNGYYRNTTPNLDRIASEGVTFTRCYCANSPCLPSRASLFSGRFGINNGIVAHHGIGEIFRQYSDGGRPWTRGHWRDPDRPLLQHTLWSQGMKTVSFSCFHDRHNAWWFAAGWEELHTFTRKRGGETADEVNDAFLPWLRQNGAQDNQFIHVHYWDIHTPYKVTQVWADRFADDPPPAWPDQEAIDAHQSIYGPKTALDILYSRPPGRYPVMPDAVRTVEDLKKLIDGYDAAIAYVDHHVGQVLDTLEELGVLEDTAIIVSGDHADSFGEHGQYTDHGIANEAVHNIPMIVRWPGLTQRGSCDALIYGMDLAPTLCELLALAIPSGWDARSFAPALRGGPFEGWPYLIWDHGIYTLTRAVRTQDWLLIHVLHPGLYPYDEPFWLHDMVNDPHQTQDVANQRPEVVAELDHYLTEWRHEQIQKSGAPDPMELMVREGPFLYMTPEQMIRRLEETGRAHLVEDLKRRVRRFHPNRL